MITLDNCQEWIEQLPERLTIIQLNFQDDQQVLCELVRNEVTSEQWDKTIDKFANREIYRIEFENVDGKPYYWVYFKEGK